jgi:hypothetical protein
MIKMIRLRLRERILVGVKLGWDDVLTVQYKDVGYCVESTLGMTNLKQTVQQNRRKLFSPFAHGRTVPRFFSSLCYASL